METNPQDILDEVWYTLEGKKYTTTEGLAKDIKKLGYVITEIVGGEYVAFKVKGTKLSFLALVSDTKPYTLVDVDTDVTFDDEDDEDKNKKKNNNRYDKSYSINYGDGYIY